MQTMSPFSEPSDERRIGPAMDLIYLMSCDGPGLLIAEYLGHHGVVALGYSCKSLHETFLEGNGATIWWKHLALRPIAPMQGIDEYFHHITSSWGEKGVIDWRAASFLVHSNLRRRKVIAPLGLPMSYRFENPTVDSCPFIPVTDMNQNHNLCFVMGNNGTECYQDWKYLPIRQGKQERPGAYGDHGSVKEPKKEWKDFELKLLTAAGTHAMKRLSERVETTVKTIHQELLNIPTLIRSGSFVGLQPEIRVLGSDTSLTLPLDSEALDAIIRDERNNCQELTYGGGQGTRRRNRHVHSSLIIELDSDAEVSDLAFQDYLSVPAAAEDASGMWTAIQELAAASSHCFNLSVSNPVTIKPNKLLIYGKGDHFDDYHRDGQHDPSHFGTLVIVLPVFTKESVDIQSEKVAVDIGGELVLRTLSSHNEKTDVQVHPPPDASDPATWHVFTLGTAHKVMPNNDEYRVALTYRLCYDCDASGKIPRLPNSNLLHTLGRSIHRWLESNAMEKMVEFMVPLKYETNCNNSAKMPSKIEEDEEYELLSSRTLLGEDFEIYSGLQEAFSNVEMKVDLEFVDIHFSDKNPLGVVRRNLDQDLLPLEEQAKVIWLNGAGDNRRLIDCHMSYGRGNDDVMSVAVISFSHEKFRCRGDGQIGKHLFRSAGWTHPDDEIRQY